MDMVIPSAADPHPVNVSQGALLLDALRAVGWGIDRYRQAVAAELGLGTAELIAIAQLHYTEPLQARQIGERTGLTPGSVTALLDRLESRGYLTRTRPTHDRRVLQIELTPAGRALGDGMAQPLVPAINTIIEDVGSEYSEAVVTVLKRIADVLGDLARRHDEPS